MESQAQIPIYLELIQHNFTQNIEETECKPHATLSPPNKIWNTPKIHAVHLMRQAGPQNVFCLEKSNVAIYEILYIVV